MTITRPHVCASKEEIAKRLSLVPQLPKPAVIYLAMADSFLEDTNLLQGWGGEIVPFEKKQLGLMELYQKLPYIMQSAIDFEVCKLTDAFAGNSFSTFSGLVAMARTMEMKRRGVLDACGTPNPSFAYNIGGPRPWVTNMSEPTLKFVSYGSDEVGCQLPHVKMQESITGILSLQEAPALRLVTGMAEKCMNMWLPRKRSLTFKPDCFAVSRRVPQDCLNLESTVNGEPNKSLRVTIESAFDGGSGDDLGIWSPSLRINDKLRLLPT